MAPKAISETADEAVTQSYFFLSVTLVKDEESNEGANGSARGAAYLFLQRPMSPRSSPTLWGRHPAP